MAIAALSNHLKDKTWLERYVHISSPEVYGTCEGTVKEDAPMNPSTPYAASKAAGDFMLFTLVKNYNFPLVTIRATNVYGAHQQLFKIIPRSVIYLKLGKIIELHGGGAAIKSYIHIRDVSRGELAAMERGANGEIYHLSPDGGIAVRDAVSTICELIGKDFERCTRTVEERLGPGPRVCDRFQQGAGDAGLGAANRASRGTEWRHGLGGGILGRDSIRAARVRS